MEKLQPEVRLCLEMHILLPCCYRGWNLATEALSNPVINVKMKIAASNSCGSRIG